MSDFFDGLVCSSCGHAHPKMTCAGFAAGLQSDSIAPSAKEAKGPWSPTTGGSTGDPHEFCFGRKIDVARMCEEHRKLLVKVPPETAVKHDAAKPDYSLVPLALVKALEQAQELDERESIVSRKGPAPDNKELIEGVVACLYNWNERADSDDALLVRATLYLAALVQSEEDGEGLRSASISLRAPLRAAARAYSFGAQKYAAFNYRHGKGIEVRRLVRATIGHVLDWADHEVLDPESKLSHLNHAMASHGMLLDTRARIFAGELPAETDNRWKENKQ